MQSCQTSETLCGELEIRETVVGETILCVAESNNSYRFAVEIIHTSMYISDLTVLYFNLPKYFLLLSVKPPIGGNYCKNY